MFQHAKTLNQNIIGWQTSSVQRIGRMFFDPPFNQPIGEWDGVSSVFDISYMFSFNRVFNQPLGNWDVSSVIDVGEMFREAEAFNQKLCPWGVFKVKAGIHSKKYEAMTWHAQVECQIRALIAGESRELTLAATHSRSCCKIHKSQPIRTICHDQAPKV